jgi:glycyl-tRNA synthetase alpha subunit
MTVNEFKLLKPGDIVVGNEKASGVYSITRTNVRCIVKEIVSTSSRTIGVQVERSLNDPFGTVFEVCADYFNCVDTMKEISEKEIFSFINDLCK